MDQMVRRCADARLYQTAAEKPLSERGGGARWASPVLICGYWSPVCRHSVGAPCAGDDRSIILLDDDSAFHVRMHRADVLVGAGLVKDEGELVALLDRRRAKAPRLIDTDDVVRLLVIACPGNRGAGRDGECRRHKGEILDLDFRRPGRRRWRPSRSGGECKQHSSGGAEQCPAHLVPDHMNLL